MRKKWRITVAALIIGLEICSVEAVATTEQFGEGIETVSQNMATASAHEEDVKIPAVIHLQIPQKMGVVIDPWELEGKGQIYSEQYTIQNMGETKGILTLSFTCRAVEEGEVTVKANGEKLHEDENKSIYIEMVFGDGNRIILSPEGSKYQTELQPGEELIVWFSGEVNENACEQWRDGDIFIEGRYTWEESQDISQDVSDKIEGEDALDNSTDESGDIFSVSGSDAAGNGFEQDSETKVSGNSVQTD